MPSLLKDCVVDLVLAGEILVVYDDRILQEYDTVLRRPKFKFEAKSIDDLINFITGFGFHISATHLAAHKFTDIDDVKFYEVAVSFAADYLVTGNLKHFPDDEWIVSPREFLMRE